MPFFLYWGMALRLAEAKFQSTERDLEWLVLHVFLSINLSHCTHHTFRLSGMAWQFVSIAATCIVGPFEEDREREARPQFLSLSTATDRLSVVHACKCALCALLAQFRG